MLYRSLLRLLGVGHECHTSVRRSHWSRGRRNHLRLEWLEDRRLLSTTAQITPGTVTGSSPVLIATTTTLSSSPNSSQYGQAVTFTATVAASSTNSGTPGGSVSFLIDSKTTVTESISSGKAVYETSSLAAGSHTIVATYAGTTTTYAASTSQTLTQVINKASTTTTLAYSGSFVVGQPLSFTATVAAVAPAGGIRTGSVTFTAQPLTTNTSTSPPPPITDTVNLSGAAGSAPTVTWSLASGLPAGSYALSASYSGDANSLGSTSTTLDKTVTQLGTSTKLTTSVNPVVTGQPVTLTATVASSTTLGGGPSGTVTFYDGTAMLGSGPQTLGTGGVVQLTLPAGFATGGSHSLKAIYNGDTNYSTSTGTLAQSVLVATSMSLGSAPNPSLYGQPVSFTAVLTAIGGIPSSTSSGGTTTTATVTGSVSFLIDSKTTVTESINGGQAVYQTTSLGAGSHTITATYNGTSLFAAAPSQTVTQVVKQASTTTTLAYSGTFVVGQPLSFTATVGAVAPGGGIHTGSVTFTAQPVTTTTSTSPPPPITDTVNLTGTASTVTWSLPSGLPAGAYALSASYSGDANSLGSTSTTLDKTVTQLGTATKLTTSVNPVVTGQPLTLTAAVASSSASLTNTLGVGPSGTVTFYDGTTMLGSGPQMLGSGGVAQLTLPAGFAIGGSHSLKAIYNGDTNYSTSTGTLAQSVLVATSMSLGSAPNPSLYGQPVSFTAALTAIGGIPVSTSSGGTQITTVIGSVSFLIDSKTTVTESINGGQAVYQTTSLGAGAHTITATYSGTSLFAAAPSQTVTQVVSKANTTTTLAYSGTFVVGQPLSFTATVGAVAPGGGIRTGTVTFTAQPVTTTTSTSPPPPITDTVNLSGTSSTVTWSLPSGLPAGAYALSASYSGDANSLGSTSATVDKTVTQLGTATKLASSVNPVVTGQPVTLTAAVASSSASLTNTLGVGPSGTVTFYDGTTMLGSGPQMLGSGGAAQLTLPAGFAIGGSHSLKAVYKGDPNYSSSTGTFTETVTSTATKTSVALTSSANAAVVGQPVTFTVIISTSTSPTIGASGMVTFLDGKTTLATVPVANDEATFTTSTLAAGSHAITAMYSGDANFTSSTSSTLTESVVLPTPGTISGAGTLLSGLDTFNVNVQSTVTGGVPTYSGTLSFTDDKTHDTFNSATITSVQINQYLTPAAGTDTYFTITGTATLTASTPNQPAVTTTGGTYNFMIVGSLPVAGVSTSTGGLEVQITGPNGFTDTVPFTAWDPGETIVVTVTTTPTPVNSAAKSNSLTAGS